MKSIQEKAWEESEWKCEELSQMGYMNKPK